MKVVISSHNIIVYPENRDVALVINKAKAALSFEPITEISNENITGKMDIIGIIGIVVVKGGITLYNY